MLWSYRVQVKESYTPFAPQTSDWGHVLQNKGMVSEPLVTGPTCQDSPAWGLMRWSEALAGVCFSCHREQASRMRSLSFPHSSPVPRIAVCTPVMLWEETLFTATWGCLSLLPWPYLSLPSITSTLTVPLLTFYNLCTFFINCLMLSLSLIRSTQIYTDLSSTFFIFTLIFH